ncbi:MAG: response regulator transcription factor [Burkholderiales bacterium]|nr:response regulator transcription factor [Burkholderiales bacterium]
MDFSTGEIPPRRIRVGVVDDHLIVRAGLRQLLSDQPGITVVGEAASGRGAVDLVRRMPMDVLLLDISMPVQSGVDAIAMIKAKAPDVGILVLSTHSVHQYGVSMLRLGASGYLNKQSEPEEIVAAVQAVAAGRRYIPPELGELLLDHAQAHSQPAHEALSDREFQVFIKLAAGERPEQVGRELSLTPKTVSSYRCRLLEKLSLHSNSELTYYAIKHKLIE